MDQSVREAYEATWIMRRQPPVVTDNWVDNDWAKGRTDYLTFLIRVDNPSIKKATKVVQDALSEIKCMDPFPPEYLHVTVKETNCFYSQTGSEDDELTQDQVDNVISAVSEALVGVNSFEIEFENINHFRSNIVIEAHDGGEVREMNMRLMGLEEIKILAYDYPKFLPHMSVCQFKCSENHEELVNLLEEMRNTQVGSFYVESIDLVKAILPKTGRHPTLETLNSFKLG